jgi:hypothetical protein
MKLSVGIARTNGNADNSAAAFICCFVLASVASDKLHFVEALQA